MPKRHPEDIKGLSSRSPSDMRAFTGDLVQKIRKDDLSRNSWLNAQALYYRRRYGLEGRNVNWPWPGASDIVMPTIDMTIDKMKAQATAVMFPNPQNKQNVRVVSSRPELYRRARADERMLNWLQIHGMRDWKRQLIFGLDLVFSEGMAIYKTQWDFSTRSVQRVFRRIDWLRRYQKDIEGLTQAGIQIQAQTAGFPGLLGQSGQQFTRDLQNNVIEAFRGPIARDLGLEPSNSKVDRDSLEKIMNFLKTSRETEVVYRTEEVETSLPCSTAISGRNLIVNGKAANIDDAPRITHRIFMQPDRFWRMAQDRGWNLELAKRAINASEGKAQQGHVSSGLAQSLILGDLDRNHREGTLGYGSDGLVEVWETDLWKRDKDGKPGRVWTALAPGLAESGHPVTNSMSLNLRPYKQRPENHGGTPYDPVYFEMTEDRFYASRGVPAKIDDIDWEITERHRSALNKAAMMVPMFKRLRGSQLGDVSFRPGGELEVSRPDEYTALEIPDYTAPDIREELQLLGWNERYLGGFDAVSSQQSIHEARTAREISAIQSTATSMLAHRMVVIQDGYRRVFDKQWDLMNQFGDPALYKEVTGADFVPLSKREMQQNFTIMPVGAVETTDPVLEAQKALARYQAALQLFEMTGGVVDGTHKINLAEAFARYLERDSQEDAAAIFRELTPEEKQQLAQQQQAAAQREQQLADFEDGVPPTPQQLPGLIREAKKASGRGERFRVRTPA